MKASATVRLTSLMCAIGAFGLAGCSGDAKSDQPEEDVVESGSTTDASPPPGETEAEPETETGSESSDDGDEAGFVVEPDGGGIAIECDVWAQDCPDDEKCMPWVSDGGGAWDATRCTPLTDNPGQPGDACTAEGGGGSGVDDCDVGVMCWDVDPETGQGVCLALCEGSPDAPLCSDPDTSCSITNDGVLPLCLPACDPLLQDCPGGQGCYWLFDESFVCAPDVSGDLGGEGEACDGFTLNLCDPGLQCMPAEAVPGCTSATSCCSVFCDLEDVDPGCLEGQECTALFAEGEAPPGTEFYGVCAIPAT